MHFFGPRICTVVYLILTPWPRFTWIAEGSCKTSVLLVSLIESQFICILRTTKSPIVGFDWRFRFWVYTWCGRKGRKKMTTCNHLTFSSNSGFLKITFRRASRSSCPNIPNATGSSMNTSNTSGRDGLTNRWESSGYDMN